LSWPEGARVVTRAIGRGTTKLVRSRYRSAAGRASKSNSIAKTAPSSFHHISIQSPFKYACNIGTPLLGDWISSQLHCWPVGCSLRQRPLLQFPQGTPDYDPQLGGLNVRPPSQHLGRWLLPWWIAPQHARPRRLRVSPFAPRADEPASTAAQPIFGKPMRKTTFMNPSRFVWRADGKRRGAFRDQFRPKRQPPKGGWPR